MAKAENSAIKVNAADETLKQLQEHMALFRKIYFRLKQFCTTSELGRYKNYYAQAYEYYKKRYEEVEDVGD